MSVLVLFLFMLFLPEITSAQGAREQQIGSVYYVSSTQGDDSNDGQSPHTAKQHLSALEIKDNVCVLLRRGDVFFEQLYGFSNSTIEAYGKGDKPIVCGFKVLVNAAWQYDEAERCWRLDLMGKENFKGLQCDDIKSDNIGFIYHSEKDKVYGHLVRLKKEMSMNGDFHISSQYQSDSIKGDTFRYLYWFIEDNPNDYNYLCFSTPLVGVSKMFSCTIRNIAVTGFNFGFTNCYHTVIENCQIDLIGGSVQIGYPKWVRYGNGIEFWGNAKNNTVRNCLISRTYDCGVTVQGGGDLKSSPENIHFTGNRFYHCRQAFEFWLNPQNNYKPTYVDCSFTDNICYEMGENEFSSPEKRDANLLCYDNWMKPIIIRDNVFWGASHFCGMFYPKGMSDNMVYLFKGQYLSYYNAKPIFLNTEDDITKYRQSSGDNSQIYFITDKKAMKRVGNRIKKRVGWQPINLHLERL